MLRGFYMYRFGLCGALYEGRVVLRWCVGDGCSEGDEVHKHGACLGLEITVCYPHSLCGICTNNSCTEPIHSGYYREFLEILIHVVGMPYFLSAWIFCSPRII